VKTLSISCILGIIISLALFWLMQMMISNNQLSFEKTGSVHMTEFVRLKRESKLKTKDRRTLEEPPPPEKRPPPPKMQMQQTQVSKSNAPQMDMPSLDIPLQTARFSGSLLSGLAMGGMSPGAISTNVIPLVKIQPRYPMRAQTRRI
jgi:protein TonB